MSTALERHLALDLAMARWAMQTRGLFSQTPLTALCNFMAANQPSGDARAIHLSQAKVKELFFELLKLYQAAVHPDQPNLSKWTEPISSLMTWSYDRVKEDMAREMGIETRV